MKISKLFYLIFSFFLLYPAISNSQEPKEKHLYLKPCFVSVQDKHVLNGNQISYIEADTSGAYIRIYSAVFGVVAVQVSKDKKDELVKNILEQLKKCQ